VADLVRIWYVSSQRLCNFRCTYCVSIGDYAKSNKIDWRHPNDHADFQRVVSWIGTTPFPVGVRLATLGEPFASWDFLDQAAWLTKQPNVEFVELLTNGSLLKSRLPKLAEIADLTKLSLWVTHHPSEISVEKLVENARFAQEKYNCFVVLNALLFPDTVPEVNALREAATAAGIRFNLDLGYDPGNETAGQYQPSRMVPILQEERGMEKAVEYGAKRELLDVNLMAMDHVHAQPCSAGNDYFYIGIDGDVYPCSRYYVLKYDRLGNIADPDFRLDWHAGTYRPCRAQFGCCNKEDFLNLQVAAGARKKSVPSLGWTAQ
jgi:MoaA/NifB/PqqE/SkfB family radical SAM enzyme